MSYVENHPLSLFERDPSWPPTIDFSGHGDPFSARYDPHYLRKNLQPLKGAEKIIVFPDFSPTEEGKIPTGVAARFSVGSNIDYLGLVGGADIGCQMRLVRLDLEESEFRGRLQLLDKTCQVLRQRKDAVALGGGNHFLDFVVFENQQVGILVHTGSFGDQQKKLGELVKRPSRYWKKYSQVMDSAERNSQTVVDVVVGIYGKGEEVGHWIHNTVALDEKTGTVIIRKGAVKVHSLNEQFIIPSSVGDRIILAKPGDKVSEDTLWSMPHGGGRKTSRGDARKFAAEYYKDKLVAGKLTDVSEFSELVLPSSLGGLPVTELPFCYYSFEETKEILAKSGLIDPVSIETLKVVSCINHI